MFFKRITIIFVFCILFLVRNSIQQVASKKNPWKEYMKIFDIPKNHGSGVLNDFGGVIVDKTYKNNTVKFRFPNGKCPVFGKTIKLVNKYNFLGEKNLVDFQESFSLPALFNGQINYDDKNVKDLNFPAKDLSKFFPKFEEFQFPSHQESIYECAVYANKFEHIIVNSNLRNCSSSQEKSCLKYSFIYNLKTKKCFILFFFLQRTEKDLLYYPTKSIPNSYIVFGSSNVVENWSKLCPMKPIKNALFGLWKNGVCTTIGESYESTFSECSNDLVSTSPNDTLEPNEHFSNGVGTNWANWEKGKCELITKRPDCLYYSKGGFAFTSVGIHSEYIYDLPPCIIGASDGWTVRASCNGLFNEKFTCQNGKWVTSTGKKITKCQSTESWSNINMAHLSDEIIDVQNDRSGAESGQMGFFTNSVILFTIALLFI